VWSHDGSAAVYRVQYSPPALSVSPIVDGYFLIRFRPANLQLFLTLGNKGDLIGFCAGRFRI